MEDEDAPGTTLIEVVLALSAWTLARAGRGGAVAAPALAAVARNTCPFLTAGMRSESTCMLFPPPPFAMLCIYTPPGDSGRADMRRERARAISSFFLSSLGDRPLPTHDFQEANSRAAPRCARLVFSQRSQAKRLLSRCPPLSFLSLHTISRRQTAEWLLDALEIYLHGAPGNGGGEGGEGGEDVRQAGLLSEEQKLETEGIVPSSSSSSWAVASMLLEGMAAAAVFHHEVRGCW